MADTLIVVVPQEGIAHLLIRRTGIRVVHSGRRDAFSIGCGHFFKFAQPVFMTDIILIIISSASRILIEVRNLTLVVSSDDFRREWQADGLPALRQADKVIRPALVPHAIATLEGISHWRIEVLLVHQIVVASGYKARTRIRLPYPVTAQSAGLIPLFHRHGVVRIIGQMVIVCRIYQIVATTHGIGRTLCSGRSLVGSCATRCTCVNQQVARQVATCEAVQTVVHHTIVEQWRIEGVCVCRHTSRLSLLRCLRPR